MNLLCEKNRSWVRSGAGCKLRSWLCQKGSDDQDERKGSSGAVGLRMRIIGLGFPLAVCDSSISILC